MFPKLTFSNGLAPELSQQSHHPKDKGLCVPKANILEVETSFVFCAEPVVQYLIWGSHTFIIAVPRLTVLQMCTPSASQALFVAFCNGSSRAPLPQKLHDKLSQKA